MKKDLLLIATNAISFLFQLLQNKLVAYRRPPKRLGIHLVMISIKNANEIVEATQHDWQENQTKRFNKTDTGREKSFRDKARFQVSQSPPKKPQQL